MGDKERRRSEERSLSRERRLRQERERREEEIDHYKAAKGKMSEEMDNLRRQNERLQKQLQEMNDSIRKMADAMNEMKEDRKKEQQKSDEEKNQLRQMLQEALKTRETEEETQEMETEDEEQDEEQEEEQEQDQEQQEEEGFKEIQRKQKREKIEQRRDEEKKQEQRRQEQRSQEGKKQDEEQQKKGEGRPPPPIFLQGASAAYWREISAEFSQRCYRFKPAMYNRNRGMKIQMVGVDDYRKATKYLDTRPEVKWFTYRLKEDSTKTLVIRGLTEYTLVAEVEEDLIGQGIRPIKVAQLKSRRVDPKPLPLFQVEIMKEDEQEVRKIQFMLNMKISMEEKRKSTQVLQCYRCQGFHHGQSTCRGTERCVKCGEEHPSRDCKRDRDTPATCTNCKGQHPASYRGCPKMPKPPTNPRQTENTQQQPPRTARTTPGMSYARATTGPKTQQTENPDSRKNTMRSLEVMLQQITNIFKQLQGQ